MSIAASNPSDASLAAPHADERELFSLLGLSHPDLQRNDKVSIDASGSVWSVVFATTDTVTVTTGDVTRRVPVSDVLLLAKAARVDTATDATKSNTMRAGRAASARAPTSGAALQVVGTDSSSQQQAAPRRSTSTPLARCTCNGREDGRQGRHRITCPRSRSFSANSRRVPIPGSIAEARGIINFEGAEDASGPTTTTAEEPAPPLGCPSFEAVAALKVGVVSFIPESARADVAAALAFTLNAVRAVPRKWAWVRLLAFAPCVLAHPGHGEKIADALAKRAREWRSSNDAWIRMFELRSLQSRKRHTRSHGAGGPGDVFDDVQLPRGFESSYGFKAESMSKITEATKERVIALARDGQYSKAVSALAPSTV
jgi:hypothetical protein